jgi:hypothetical protein
MNQFRQLTKDQIQKIVLSTMGFVILLYVYFSFFLGPLNKSRAVMTGKIDELQSKLSASKDNMSKTASLELKAKAATTRFAALKALNPEGAPIAWFPPRMKSFFANQQIDRALAKLDGSTAFKEKELSEWMNYSWTIEIPQADFDALGKAMAALENTEPLLSVTKIKMRALPDTPQFQQVALTTATILQKR